MKCFKILIMLSVVGFTYHTSAFGQWKEVPCTCEYRMFIPFESILLNDVYYGAGRFDSRQSVIIFDGDTISCIPEKIAGRYIQAFRYSDNLFLYDSEVYGVTYKDNVDGTSSPIMGVLKDGFWVEVSSDYHNNLNNYDAHGGFFLKRNDVFYYSAFKREGSGKFRIDLLVDSEFFYKPEKIISIGLKTQDKGPNLKVIDDNIYMLNDQALSYYDGITHPMVSVLENDQWVQVGASDWKGSNAKDAIMFQGNLVVGGQGEGEGLLDTDDNIKMLVNGDWVNIGSKAMGDSRLNRDVHDLEVHKGKLYALVNRESIWVYDGLMWEQFAPATFYTDRGATNFVTAMRAVKDRLVVSGGFEKVDEDSIDGTAYVDLLNENNEPPIAVNDEFVSLSNGQDLWVTQNDSDPNEDYLLVTIIKQPNQGKARVGHSDQIIYLPHDRVNQVKDTLTYQVCDRGGLCDTAQLFITTAFGNQTPYPHRDTVYVNGLSSDTINLLTNDYDPDGDSITVKSIALLGDESFELIGDSFVVFKPTKNEDRLASTTYTACDQYDSCKVAELVVKQVSDSTLTSIQNGMQVNYLSVFPNPTSNSFSLSNKNPVEFEIYNITGQKVWNGRAAANQQINPNLTPGSYLIKVILENNSPQVLKLMVQ